MLGRREALRAIFAAPALVKAIASAAAASATGEIALGGGHQPSGVGTVAEKDERDPLWEILSAAEREMDLIDSVRGAQERYLPPHISEMKSWSTAFKKSVWAKEERENREARAKLQDLLYGDKSTLEKMKILKRLGLKIESDWI